MRVTARGVELETDELVVARRTTPVYDEAGTTLLYTLHTVTTRGVVHDRSGDAPHTLPERPDGV